MHISNEEDFSALLKSDKVIVKFGAKWCIPCKKVEPEFNALEKAHSDIKFLNVDIDILDDEAAKHKVSSIPCFILFRKGREHSRVVGADMNKVKLKISEL
jgi:thioredoxin 1